MSASNPDWQSTSGSNGEYRENVRDDLPGHRGKYGCTVNFQIRNDDEPITTEEADLFGRDGYAARVAEQIVATHSGKASVVFGLTGPWGSGKTSLINLIENVLAPKGGEYSVVRFTPWAAQDVSSLLGEFYAALLGALPKRKRANARRAFGSLLRIAAPMAIAIPIAGASAGAAATAAADSLTKHPSWDEAFQTAADHIAASSKKILVVVDDIDRLQGDELLTVLKVVRLLGRFPGVQYLLAYDHDSLMHTLTTAHAARSASEARRYIEKMVQYPVPVPALIGAQIVSLLNAGIAEVMQRRRLDSDLTDMRRLRDLMPTMRATLNTPRSISRYISQLDYDLSMHPPGETDVEDVMGLTLLRVVFPELHTKLPQYQHQLVTSHTYEAATASTGTGEYEPFNLDDLLTDLTPADREHARTMLHMLFPKFKSEHNINPRRGVATQSYFGRYFTMTILANFDLPDSVVGEAMQAAVGGGGGDGTKLLKLLHTDREALAFLALDKAEEAFSAELQKESTTAGRDQKCVALLMLLAPALDDLGEPGAYLFTFHDLVSRWVAREVLAAISSDTEPARVVEGLRVIRVPRTRIAVLHHAKSSPKMQGTPRWWVQALAGALPDAQEEFLDHLRQKDRAPETRNDLIEFFRLAHVAGVELDPLRKGIARAIAAGEFGVEHLASRFITTDQANRLSRNQNDFNIIAPRDDYEWYAQPEHPFTVDANNWTGRRILAASRIEKPVND